MQLQDFHSKYRRVLEDYHQLPERPSMTTGFIAIGVMIDIAYQNPEGGSIYTSIMESGPKRPSLFMVLGT